MTLAACPTLTDSGVADFVIAIVGAFLSGAISAVVAYFVAKATNSDGTEKSLHLMIDKMIDISIAYPYVESDHYCQKWSMPQDGAYVEMSDRYESYCCFVFNLLERVWKYCGADENKMKGFIYYEEVIVRHKRWWRVDRTNRSGYEGGFVKFVDAVALRAQK